MGLSALLVSTNRAMREPLHCGTGNRTGSTFLCISQKLKDNHDSNGAGWHKQKELTGMLDLIHNNPYRLLGIYSNSSTKERVANHNRLKAFLKVGRVVSFELDFPMLLPAIIRSVETVADAEAKLTLPNEQLWYAQFWFIKATPLDDIAMNHLVAGDVDGAIAIWQKKDSASSLQNRIVCALIQDNYTVALSCAEKLYSLYAEEFVNSVLGEQHTVDIEKIEFCFLDELCSAIGAKDILPFLQNNDWKRYVGDKTIKPLIETLQMAIDTAKASRGQGITARYNAGAKLMQETETILTQLRTLLPVTDLQYQMIADKLGLEILQCGIDFYNASEAADAAHKAMKLQSYALSIVVGKMAKDRCEENVDILQKIIDNLPPQEVFAEDKAIKEELRAFCKLSNRIKYAVALLEKTKPHLQSIKEKLGVGNSYYLEISTQVVGNALHDIIEEVNAVQSGKTIDIGGKQIPISMLLDRDAKIKQIKATLKEAWSALKIIDTFDMESSFKTKRYNQNRSILKKMCKQLGVSTTTDVPYFSPPSSSVTTRPPKTQTSSSADKQTGSTSNSSDDSGCIIGIVCFVIGAIIGGAVAEVGGMVLGGLVALAVYGGVKDW